MPKNILIANCINRKIGRKLRIMIYEYLFSRKRFFMRSEVKNWYRSQQPKYLQRTIGPIAQWPAKEYPKNYMSLWLDSCLKA